MMELDANLCHLEKLAPDMPRVCLLIALPKLNIEVVAVPAVSPTSSQVLQLCPC